MNTLREIALKFAFVAGAATGATGLLGVAVMPIAGLYLEPEHAIALLLAAGALSIVGFTGAYLADDALSYTPRQLRRFRRR